MARLKIPEGLGKRFVKEVFVPRLLEIAGHRQPFAEEYDSFVPISNLQFGTGRNLDPSPLRLDFPVS